MEQSALSGRALSVTELTAAIKDLLEGSFGPIVLEGEISNYRPSSTGHLYFTLKDAGAAISAVMFKGSSRTLTFTPKDGMLVRVSGRISVYPQRGSYQIIADTMSAAGAGAILQLLEERKQKLAAEGLFNADTKRPLPPFPRTVGVVTSPTGAALRDILQIIRRRSPCTSVIVFPCPVQGEHAGAGIAAMIRAANRYRTADVLIVGRGGGSLEDLLPFSEEAVVRAVAASQIPVISAVGHEIDWALSDFAADVRAPTPSAAAELATPLQAQLVQDIGGMADTLLHAVQAKIAAVRTRLSVFTPESLEFRFRAIEQPLLLRFDSAKEALLANMQQTTQLLRLRVQTAENALHAADPHAILQRGYSVVTDTQTGRIVKSWQDVRPQSNIRIQTAAGSIAASVTDACPDAKELPHEEN